jgi:hypothetical protein
MDAEKEGVLVERISIVEKNKHRASRLNDILRETWPQAHASTTRERTDPQQIRAGTPHQTKPHVLVAMPFSKDFMDVFVFGIQGPVNAVGYLCERIDMTAVTGDVLARIKSRIETAELVIADLTGANANVYLEVGYAWGKGRPLSYWLRMALTLSSTFKVKIAFFMKVSLISPTALKIILINSFQLSFKRINH